MTRFLAQMSWACVSKPYLLNISYQLHMVLKYRAPNFFSPIPASFCMPVPKCIDIYMPVHVCAGMHVLRFLSMCRHSCVYMYLLWFCRSYFLSSNNMNKLAVQLFKKILYFRIEEICEGWNDF